MPKHAFNPVNHCTCGEILKPHEIDNGICFFCTELENNRRYRYHHSLGEYAPEPPENQRSSASISG